MRVVLDTVVFVRALINGRSFSGRILSEFTDRFVLLVSQETARELLEVIRRPGLTTKYKRLSAIPIGSIIELIAQAEIVSLDDVPQVVRDLKDDIFIATARIGHANFLVTEDQDLLVLGNQFGFDIINAKTFIQYLEEK